VTDESDATVSCAMTKKWKGLSQAYRCINIRVGDTNYGRSDYRKQRSFDRLNVY